MKRAILSLAAAACALGLARTAEASLISAVTQTSGAGVIANVSENSAPPLPGTDVDLVIDVLQLHQGFTVNFATAGATLDQIRFNITLNNLSTAPIYQLAAVITSNTNTFTGFSTSPPATPWTQYNNTNTIAYVGGLMGHSFQLLPGGPAQTITLDLGVGSFLGAGSFDITFTANPEPGTIVLASIVALGFGGMIYRKRRQTAGEAAPAPLAV